ncbi:hypothetical protein Peur_039860 [Populus x canadensis]
MTGQITESFYADFLEQLSDSIPPLAGHGPANGHECKRQATILCKLPQPCARQLRPNSEEKLGLVFWEFPTFLDPQAPMNHQTTKIISYCIKRQIHMEPSHIHQQFVSISG